jgi:Toprim-like
MTPWIRDLVQAARDGFTPTCLAATFLACRGISYEVASSAGVGYLPRTHVAPCSLDFQPWAKFYLRERLVFPLSTADGKYTGLQTRSFDEAAKGKDRYQTYVLPGVKGIEPPMFHTEYAAPLLWAGRWQVVLVEGPIDALAVRAAGEPCVVAGLTGTPPLATRAWCRRWAGSILALLDMDPAGRRGVDTLTDYPGLLVSAPAFATKDPGELWMRSPAALTALVARPSEDDLLTYLRDLR